jgi:copper transport protein
MTQVSVRVRRAAGVLIALVAAALTVLGTAGAASAHGSLVSTDPADGSVVPSPPSAVTLTFDDAVGLPPDALRVFGPEGERADAGAPDHAGDRTETLRVALREDLRDGTYTVAWQAISADSHPVGGAFTFSVGAPSETSVSAEELQGPRTDGLIGFLYGTVSGIAYAGFALLAGAASFVVLCWPAGASVRRVQKLLVAGWVALLGSTAVQMMLRGPYEAGSGVVPGETAPETAAHVAVDQITYVALAVRLLLLVVSGVLLVLLVGAQARPSGGEGTRSTRLPVWLRVAGLASAAGMAATWVVADHASEGPQVWLAMPVTVLHVLAMAAWLGGLVTLLAGLGHGLPPVAAARFSRLAFGSVLVLVLTGLYRSWRDVGSWEALFGTRWR